MSTVPVRRRPISVTHDPDLERVLAERAYDDSASGVLRRMVLRYEALAHGAAVLQTPELLVIHALIHPKALADIAALELLPERLARADAHRLPKRLRDAIDVIALVEKLRAMSLLQLVAVADTLERWIVKPPPEVDEYRPRIKPPRP